jgi:two-component system, OmpR family, sensor histidine kinase KdpD
MGSAFDGRPFVTPGGVIPGEASNRLQRVRLAGYAWAVGIIALTSGLARLLRPYLQITDVAMLFLLAVVVVAYRHRRGPALVASILSIAAFDFGFVPPYRTFEVSDSAYLLTFAVMLAVALTMSQLTARIGEQAEEAQDRERQTAALYALSRDLSEHEDLELQLATATRHLSTSAGGEAQIFLDGSGQKRPDQVWPSTGIFESLAVRVAASWAHEHGQSAGWGTNHCAEAEALVVPLRADNRTIGVVTIVPDTADRILTGTERRTIEALADQAATAFERTVLAQGQERARGEVEAERLRTALLSSLSHDLRTPLGSIEGAASSLLQGLPVEAQREMAETILEESRRMTRLVTNLLDMVRVESGALAVQKAWQPLEEALGVALLRVEARLNTHPTDIRLPVTLPLVPIDELLIEQVFINLLENAARHTPAGTPITVTAWEEGTTVVVEVADRGPGIPKGEEEAVFRKFQRSSGTDRLGPAGGSGLGLTICRGIIGAHGGRIWLEPTSVGAAFRFSLPLDGPRMSALPDEAQND